MATCDVFQLNRGQDCFDDEVCAEGEAGLEAKENSCTKNPGHIGFVPVTQFSIDHLPEDYRNEAIFDLVKTLAELTVRISVTYTSMSRPKKDPRRGLEYPQYKKRGSTVSRFGSGRIWGVQKYTDAPCPCKRCQASMEPRRAWGRVFLYTATHVVFDNSEGAWAKIKWGLNSNTEDAATAIEGVGAAVIGDMERDKCTMTCVTCDVVLVDKLAGLVDKYRGHYVKVYKKYSVSDLDHRLTVVVSHPHGREKKITFGRWKERCKFSDQRGLVDTTYIYTAETCPGCSGAPVYVLGKVWYTLNHSGSGPEGNYSGGGWGVYTN